MNNPFELTLPPRPEMPTDEAKALQVVTASLQTAITSEPDKRRLPSLDTLSAHFGLPSAVLDVMRKQLISAGYLIRVGREYFTAHPRPSLWPTNTTGRGDGHCV